jgi:hypothetical protein
MTVQGPLANESVGAALPRLRRRAIVFAVAKSCDSASAYRKSRQTPQPNIAHKPELTMIAAIHGAGEE